MSKKISLSEDLMLLATHLVETDGQVEHYIKTMVDENLHTIYCIEYAANSSWDKKLWNKVGYWVLDTGHEYLIYDTNKKLVNLSKLDYSEFFEIHCLFRFITKSLGTSDNKVKILKTETFDEYNF